MCNAWQLKVMSIGFMSSQEQIRHKVVTIKQQLEELEEKYMFNMYMLEKSLGEEGIIPFTVDCYKAYPLNDDAIRYINRYELSNTGVCKDLMRNLVTDVENFIVIEITDQYKSYIKSMQEENQCNGTKI